MPNLKFVCNYCLFLFFLQIQNTFRIEILGAECILCVHLVNEWIAYIYVYQFINYITCIK